MASARQSGQPCNDHHRSAHAPSTTESSSRVDVGSANRQSNMTSPDLDEEDDQHQPFLTPDRQSGLMVASRSRPRSHAHSLWKLCVFFLLITVTVLALSAVSLGLSPTGGKGGEVGHGQDDEHGGQGDHHDQDHGDKQPEAEHSHEEDEKPKISEHNNEVPDVPRVRDLSEYILDSSWDINAAPTTREYHWTIVDAELNPDGVYRPMILINNQFPGPLVECNDGDTIVVHIDNKAVNATSIHFHGLFQNGTNAMDGTVGVTQCPIAPNSTFTYKFDIHGQSGTYWYHAHHSAQASDGLLGPVVIHSKDERTLQELDYSTDRIIMVQDHYHNTTAEILMDYLKPDMENDEPVPDNALINGRGARDCADFPGWRCDASNTSTPIFDLAAGKRHRLRFINVGAFAEFQIQFDEHPFHITEVDGTDVHPEPFHRLNILPAQRYSLILETNVTTASTYWMRARMLTHCFTTRNKLLQPEIRGIVRYFSEDKKPEESEPSSRNWDDAIEVVCRDLNTTALHPVVHISPPPADDFVPLRANFEIQDWRLARGYFNESTWHMNATYPSLHRFLDAGPKAASLNKPLAINTQAFDPAKDFVLQTSGIRTVDISINNFDDGAHPFHLHGHKFFILLQGNSGYPPSGADLPSYLEKHGLTENPLRRDTVTVEGYAWVVIRVVLDNPGIWTFHCHNTWHSESGMVMQMLVRSEVVRRWEVDAEQRDMCKREGVETGMRPDDSIWFGSF